MRYFHMSGKSDSQPRFSIEIWSGDEVWGPTVHFKWRWRGAAHWLFFKVPFT